MFKMMIDIVLMVEWLNEVKFIFERLYSIKVGIMIGSDQIMSIYVKYYLLLNLYTIKAI